MSFQNPSNQRHALVRLLGSLPPTQQVTVIDDAAMRYAHEMAAQTARIGADLNTNVYIYHAMRAKEMLDVYRSLTQTPEPLPPALEHSLEQSVLQALAQQRELAALYHEQHVQAIRQQQQLPVTTTQPQQEERPRTRSVFGFFQAVGAFVEGEVSRINFEGSGSPRCSVSRSSFFSRDD